MMMLDPQADVGRRLWLRCPHCGDDTGLYFLDYEVNLAWVQCGNCLRRWWHDTEFGRGGRPDGLLTEGLFDVA